MFQSVHLKSGNTDNDRKHGRDRRTGLSQVCSRTKAQACMSDSVIGRDACDQFFFLKDTVLKWYPADDHPCFLVSCF